MNQPSARPQNGPIHQLAVDAARYARAANTHTGAALRHALEGRDTLAAVERLLARSNREHLRLVAHTRHQVAIQRLAGVLAGEGLAA